ncbi:SUMF1/EgtB/PvdO family nonheme iron enzyme [Nitrosomonas sp. Nm51]|uniref:formylglycine-generating enzyme family protein n=1 Tax=Nitrosomonas sp. Nm51 TaxID=133720 RepID=UPI000B823F52|nr:SUMF1/EgtB/PvdO family nonheme iron enzyme [Nitrosomonas sp. Nm51]
MAGDRSASGAGRVIRGGSWNNNGRNVRSANRNRNSPDKRNNNLGFRLALAQHAAGWCVNDQIVIPFFAVRKNKKPGRRYASNARKSAVNACRVADLVKYTIPGANEAIDSQCS